MNDAEGCQAPNSALGEIRAMPNREQGVACERIDFVRRRQVWRPPADYDSARGEIAEDLALPDVVRDATIAAWRCLPMKPQLQTASIAYRPDKRRLPTTHAHAA